MAHFEPFQLHNFKILLSFSHLTFNWKWALVKHFVIAIEIDNKTSGNYGRHHNIRLYRPHRCETSTSFTNKPTGRHRSDNTNWITEKTDWKYLILSSLANDLFGTVNFFLYLSPHFKIDKSPFLLEAQQLNEISRKMCFWQILRPLKRKEFSHEDSRRTAFWLCKKVS